MTDIEQEARTAAKRVVNADVVLAAVRTIGIGLSAARGAPERAVAISNTRVRLARLIDQIEGQAHPASPATREAVAERIGDLLSGSGFGDDHTEAELLAWADDLLSVFDIRSKT